ncbi:MAG TPA: hypothetical protein VHM19_17660 [Polyangiales bacterium]|nr:hypothetical protein [Polyangiales bacterium]
MAFASLLLIGFGLIGVGCGGASASSPGASSANDVHEDDDGDGDEHPPAPQGVVHKQGSGSVSAVLGPQGGTLELTDGPRVEVPAGAVEGGQEFVLKTAQKTTAFGNKEHEKAVGPTFSFAPDVTAPSGKSITVSVPLPSVPQGWGDPAIAYEIDEGQVVGAEDSTRTKWQYDNAKLQGGRVVAQLPQLPGLRLQFVISNLEAQ